MFERVAEMSSVRSIEAKCSIHMYHSTKTQVQSQCLSQQRNPAKVECKKSETRELLYQTSFYTSVANTLLQHFSTTLLYSALLQRSSPTLVYNSLFQRFSPQKHHHKNTTTTNTKDTTTKTPQKHNHTTNKMQKHNHTTPKTQSQKNQKYNHKNTATPPQKPNHKNTKNTTTPPQKHHHKNTTTKHHHTTTKTQYYSVLQSTTPVLLCTTKCYKVPLQYYFVLQNATPVLLSTNKWPALLRFSPVKNAHFTTALGARHARSDERVARWRQKCPFYHSFERPTHTKYRKSCSATCKMFVLPQF